MRCDACKGNIEDGQESELHGRTLCEDCYIDTLAPGKACDPWAVYSAKSFAKEGGPNLEVTEMQSKILQLLKETGGAEPKILAERLDITASELEREIATLRHMEKVRGELQVGKKILRLW